RGRVPLTPHQEELAMTSSPASTRGLGALGGLLTGVGFFGGVAAAKATEKAPYPRPGAEPEEVRKYFTESSTAARLSAVGQAASAAALAGFTASGAGPAGRAGPGGPARARGRCGPRRWPGGVSRSPRRPSRRWPARR